MMFVYFLNSIIGTIVLAPIVIATYESVNRYPDITNWNPAYHMIYSGVSLGIGAAFGFLCGLG